MNARPTTQLLSAHTTRVPLGGRRRIYVGRSWRACLDRIFSPSRVHAADGVTRLANPLAPKDPHFDAPAKSVIFLFMYGGPSHIDTFDYKPNLYALDGKTVPIKTFGRGGKKSEGRVVGPEVEVSAVRRVRQVGERPCFRTWHTRGRYGLHPFHVCRQPHSRLGHAHDELRPSVLRTPVPGQLGQLRPGFGQREPAGLCGHAGSHRRSD